MGRGDGRERHSPSTWTARCCSATSSLASATTHPPFPHGILAINIGGALALGLVAGAALEGQVLVIVAGGGIGSFTTFSTWILDSHRLADAGHTHLVWLNLGLSLLAGFAAVALGHWLAGGLLLPQSPFAFFLPPRTNKRKRVRALR